MSEALDFGFQEHKMLPHREAFVPGWYRRHVDMGLELWTGTSDNPRPFVVNGVRVKIHMIPPERRYAVALDGRILDQREFEELHERYYITKFQIADVAPDDPKVRPIPTVQNFLSYTEDPSNPEKLILIGFDPYKPKPADAPARPVDDEPVVDPRMLGSRFVAAPGGVTSDARREQGYRELERLRDVKDTMPPEAYQTAVNQVLESLGLPTGSPDTASGAEPSSSVGDAPAAPSTEVPVETRPRKKRKPVEAPCGRQLQGGLHFHIAKCDKCKTANEMTEAAHPPVES